MKYESLSSGEDYMLKPVLAGLIQLRDLYDTTYTLAQIALLNDAIDVKAENEHRLAKWTKDHGSQR